MDKKYFKLLEEILRRGDTINDPSRGVDTIQIPFWEFSWDMREGFPAPVTKKLFMKSVVDELSWFLSGSDNIKPLEERGCPIWRKDAYNMYLKMGGSGSMGDFLSRLGDPMGDQSVGYVGPSYGKQMRDFFGTDQIVQLFRGLMEAPLSRRHRVNMWNPAEIGEVALPWCHTDFDVIVHKHDKGYSFDLAWAQRSVDVFLGLPFNIASYALLGKIIEAGTGYEFRGLFGALKRVHIYEPHIKSVEAQLCNDPDAYPLPKLELGQNLAGKARKAFSAPTSCAVDDLSNSLTYSNIDFQYQSCPPIRAEMIAPKVNN